MMDSELGFAGMTAAGMYSRDAWQVIHESAMKPEIQAILAKMDDTEEGRRALARSRALWAERGLPPPWEPDAAPGP